MELSDWLVFLHILGAIVWMGAALVQTAVVTRARRDPDRSLAVQRAHELEWVGPWLIGPASLVVIALGIWITVREDWISFSQTWIWLSLVLVAVSTVLGIGYFGPEGKRIGTIVSERGPNDPEAQRRVGRLQAVSYADLVILAAVLWLMVFKPGV